MKRKASVLLAINGLLISLLFSACSSPSSNDASIADVENSISADGTGNVAFNGNQNVPSFPKQIADYELIETQSNQTIRIFVGDDWKPFLERYREGNSMSCQPEIWIVRWKSNNPGITLKTTYTYLSGEYGFDEDTGWMGFAPIGSDEKISIGQTGYIGGESCVSPVFQWGNDDGSATLVDVYYEYQIWNYKPKI